MKFIHVCPLTKKKTIITGKLVVETTTSWVLENVTINRGDKVEIKESDLKYSLPKGLYDLII